MIIQNADSANVFVNNYNITLGTNFDTLDLATSNINVTIANNTGVIHSLPDSINIDFTSSTFGHNILDANGKIVISITIQYIQQVILLTWAEVTFMLQTQMLQDKQVH